MALSNGLNRDMGHDKVTDKEYRHIIDEYSQWRRIYKNFVRLEDLSRAARLQLAGLYETWDIERND